jgi:glycosyltransferase involved in cell wall biosynthesis
MKGGVARAAARVAAIMQAEGCAVHACVFAERGESVDTTGLVHRIDIPSENEAPLERAMAMYAGVRDLDARYSFDLFHGFFLPAAQPCLQAVARAPRPVIASSRGSDATLWLQDVRRRQTIESVLRRADWITAVSQDGLRRLSALVPLEARSTIIPNSVSNDAFAGRTWPDPVCRGVVGTVAEFYGVKQIPLLVEAYAALPRNVRTKLLLVGDFAEEAERRNIVSAIKRCNVGAEVEITGYLDAASVRRCLGRMNVFVQCSAAEGFSNALLEAAASGVPVVTSCAGGAEELLAAEAEAVSVAGPDATSLSAAIENVLTDATLAERCSHSAIAAARCFSIERERAAWRELYTRVLAAFTRCAASG